MLLIELSCNCVLEINESIYPPVMRMMVSSQCREHPIAGSNIARIDVIPDFVWQEEDDAAEEDGKGPTFH